MKRKINPWYGASLSSFLALTLVACAGTPPPVPHQDAPVAHAYRIAPGDSLNIVVWRHPDISLTLPVRPDGSISAPLVEDLPASGKTPTRLARDLEAALSTYIQNPKVTVVVTQFAGAYLDQVRVVGQAQRPQALDYRRDMTVLDVLIEVGGLTEFAAGNRARLIRMQDGERREYTVRLNDLIRRGDISANVAVRPGDVLIIPESFF